MMGDGEMGCPVPGAPNHIPERELGILVSR